MLKYEIRDVVSDYGIYENGELKLIVNSRANAEYIKAILEVDGSRPNAATVYAPRVADMSDEEVLAVFRLCCAEGYHCKECPLHGNPDGCKVEDVDQRVLAMAEKWLNVRNAPISPAQTYGDLVRRMTDEQLADVLSCPQDMDEEMVGIPAGGWGCPKDRNCIRCIDDFLKKQVGQGLEEQE